MTALFIHRETWKVHGLALSIVTALHVGVLLWLSMGGMEPTLQAPKRKPLHLQFIHTSQVQSLSKTKQKKPNATLEKVAVPQSQSSTKTNDLIRDYAVVQTAASTSRQKHQFSSESLSKIQAVKPAQAPTELPLIVNDTETLQSVANANKFDAKNYQPVEKVEPPYPEQALDRDLEGNCTVVYNVNENGGVELPKAEGDCHPLFVESSINAALNFKYQPYVFDGHAVMVQNVRYTFLYQISKSS